MSSVTPRVVPPGFASLDDAVTAGGPGALVVTVRDDECDALLAHVSRRLRAAGHTVVRADATGVSLFAEVATQLGVGPLPCDGPNSAATALTHMHERLAILGALPEMGSWDDAVLQELAGRCILVLTTSSSRPSWGAWATSSFDVTTEMAVRDKLRWLAAVVESSEPSIGRLDLNGLDAWWGGRASVRSVPRADATAHLSAAAIDVACVLAIAGRSLPRSAITPSDFDASSIEELRAAGVLAKSDHALTLEAHLDRSSLEGRSSRVLREKAAAILGRSSGALAADPWALARAAELLFPERPMDADAAMSRAARAAGDRRITSDLDATWFATVTTASAGNFALRLRGAERALARNEAHDAVRWCESVADGDRHDPHVCILMAKARAQLGDLVSARVLLESIRGATTDDGLRAAIAVEQSEIGYLTGEHSLALGHATTALTFASSEKVRLDARNVIGKILLARGEWDAADSHFAEDAMTAHVAGDSSAELRARLNRGIALVSKGLLDEAHRVFGEVRDAAEKSGDARGAAFALSNLGIVAYRRHDYAAALEFWEATIERAGAFEGRHAVANLAELRLRLGLVDNAEQAILFGQRVSGHGQPPLRAAQFDLVAAQIALARGSSEIANARVKTATVHARAAGDIDFEGAIAVVGARIALADGDLRSAREWLASASAKAKTTRSVAELAILRAMVLRAAGQPGLTAATEALAFARGAAEDDLLIDVHALVAICARDERQLETAAAHCTRAVAIRDRIAATLPAYIRDSFLDKPEMRALALLEQSLAAVTLPPPPPESETKADVGAPPTSERSKQSHYAELVGDGPRMQALLTTLGRAATSDATILVSGESGTGKELVARALHAASQRADGPLVVVNCAALVETLLLSELFGHEKGAFTGASARRRGRFELADGGTLFLDEIGDISPRTQVALLRVLQEKTFERVGGTTTLRTDVRVVCATHRDLRAMVERGEFREDLYYRIRGIMIVVPPLRARREDIPLLASHLLVRICAEQQRRPGSLALTADAVDLLTRHRWPGNVRELENVLRAASVFASGDVITRDDVLGASAELNRGEEVHASSLGSDAPERPVTVAAYAHVREHRISLHDMKREIERACITRALAESNGSITRAAELLGMKRPRVSQLVKQYGLSATSTEES